MRMTLTIAAALAMIACGTAVAQEAEAPAAVEETVEAAEQVQPAQAGERVEEDLIALYRFDNVVEGTVIPDATQDFGGLDLVIQGAIAGSPVEVRDNAVQFAAPELTQVPGLFSSGPATDIVNAIRAAGQLTVEAWITPASAELTGPARIVSISRSWNERNITLGQEGDTYQLRLRTSGDQEGTPFIQAPEGMLRVNELQHVAVTFDGQYRTIYLDGEPVAESADNGGTLDNWDETMLLVIGNETDGDRRWLGSVHLVALYASALSPEEIVANFEAGL
ncbi:MAG: LamG domain-containing protein [Armatimonadota bacterium]